MLWCCLLFLLHLALGNKRVVYWNIPTFQCDSHQINFTQVARKYNIVQNGGDRFRGQEFLILYDPGSFPAILTQGSEIIQRNGGVPQAGNFSQHEETLSEQFEQLVPANFSGVGVLDFESWRPIFRQNWGVLTAYKDLSYKLEREKHRLWPQSWIEKEAKQRFELGAKLYMEETLKLCRKWRPRAQWGYYHYPYCFNTAPNNLKRDCPKEVIQENEQLTWLFNASSNLHPSLYLARNLTVEYKVEMIEGRVQEAQRLRTSSKQRILPYYWYKYHDSAQFLSKEDAFGTLTALGGTAVDGLILWGSSNDVNTKAKCKALYNYVNNILGPLLINTIN